VAQAINDLQSNDDAVRKRVVFDLQRTFAVSDETSTDTRSTTNRAADAPASHQLAFCAPQDKSKKEYLQEFIDRHGPRVLAEMAQRTTSNNVLAYAIQCLQYLMEAVGSRDIIDRDLARKVRRRFTLDAGTHSSRLTGRRAWFCRGPIARALSWPSWC